MTGTVPVPLLTKSQARKLTDRIAESVEQTWALLHEAHDREAWRALGYSAWAAYVEAEFGLSRSQANRLVVQADVILQIEAATSEPVTVSARQAQAVKPALAEVVERVSAGESPTAVVAEVARARATRKPGEPGRTVPTPEPNIGGQATQEKVRHAVALIAGWGPEVLARCCTRAALLDAMEAIQKATDSITLDHPRPARPAPPLKPAPAREFRPYPKSEQARKFGKK